MTHNIYVFSAITLTVEEDTPIEEKKVGCFEDNIDYFGNDYKIDIAPNATACQKLCSEEDPCNYWTFVKSTTKCRMKYTKTVGTTCRDCIAGPKYCEGIFFTF